MALVSKGRMMKRNAMRGLTVLGVDLNDAREEIFVRLICDGISIGVAFARAGFTSKHQHAAYNLFNLPRVQERAGKILEARRSTGVVTLSQVTDMLQRVFAGAHMEGEYSAAHNAAFSLARLYGHVTDKATLEVIRRPSRDPDAPSEQALESWAASLPVVEASQTASQRAFHRAPAALLGPECVEPTTQPEIEWLARATEGPGLASRGVETGNGAPVDPVTGTPSTGGGSDLLGPLSTEKGTGTSMGVANEPPKVPGYGEGVDLQTGGCTPRKENQLPETNRVPVQKWPPIEDLF